LINNRQAGRRNRGRNNGRPNGQNRGGGDNGNRIDNRARGNAAQLLEKYRNLARDAQLAGDRVNMEYYFQFADHYFRVLADNRARQEEQNPNSQPQRFRRNDENFDDEFDGMEEGLEGEPAQPQSYNGNGGGNAGQRDDEGNGNRRDAYRGGNDRGERNGNERNDRNNSERADRNDGNRNDRGNNRRDRDFNRQPRPAEDRPAATDAPRYEAQDPAPRFEEAQAAPAPAEAADAPRRRGRPRKAQPEVQEADSGFDATLLPPAISRADNDSDGDTAAEAAPRRRGRPRKVQPEAAE
jgi:hypothetical protein